MHLISTKKKKENSIMVKLSEGIRKFAKDVLKLGRKIQEILNNC
jgi:transaldolase